jgi:hypothetical protein
VSTAATVEATADRAARSDVARQMGRWGLVARGVVYLIVAALSLRIASGDGATADREGALRAVVRQPLGRWVLAALTLGFATYAAYRFLRAVTGREERATGERAGVGKRLENAAIGVLYVGLFLSSAKLLLGDSGSSRGGDQRERGWTAELLSHPWGPWVVVAAGVSVVVIGIVLVAMGVREDFAEKLREDGMKPWQRRWLPRLGVFGYVSRGVVVGIIGVFLVKAAFTRDAGEYVGVDGALHRLASAPLGPLLLTVVALGLAAFGAYSLVEARWRRVLET